MKVSVGVLCSFAMFAGASICQAGPTGLYAMPIADVLGHGEGYYTYSITGNEKNIDPIYHHAHGVELGLLGRCELGFDNNFSGTTSYNWKVLLIDDPKNGKYGLSVGGTNYGDGLTPGTLAVGRYNFDWCRMHLGYWQSGDNRLILGFDGACPDHFRPLKGASWQLEHLSGDSGITWASINFPIKELPGLSAMVGVGVPTDKANGVQHSLTLTYGFKF